VEAAATTTVVGLFDVVGVLAHHQPSDQAEHGEAEHKGHRTDQDQDPRFHIS
jgi:hypothetical protein